MEYEEFRKKALKVGSHEFKATNSNGLRQAYRWIKKNKWLNIGQPLTEQQFSKIVKSINLYLQEELLKGKDIILPCRMGRLELRKINTGVCFKDDKLHISRPIDWKKTLQLWWQDEESKEEKRLIRHETGEIFTVFYKKGYARYKNKIFYKYEAPRSLKLKLKQKIINKSIDAFLLYKNDGLH